MPQMSPLWWTSLFIMFLFTYMIVMVMIYFYNNFSINNNLNNKSSLKSLNWKW